MKTLIIILALVSSTAFAKGGKSPLKMLGNMDKIEAKCPALKLTKEQKVDITKNIVEMKKAAKPLRSDMKTAKKTKRKVMMDASTTKEEAIAAQKEFRKARRPLMKLRKSTALNVQFDILSGEQRVELLKCMKKRRGGN